MNFNNNFLFLKNLKLRNIYPFHISEVNKIFFETDIDLQNNQFLYKKFISELPKNNNFNNKNVANFLNLERINQYETFQKIINCLIKKINSIIGSKDVSLFFSNVRDETGDLIYVTNGELLVDLKVIGDKLAKQRFIFKIQINPKCYLYEYVKEIYIIFYFDKKNKMISGAISLEWGLNSELNETTKHIFVDKIFLNNLCRYFLEKEFKKISMINLIELFEDMRLVKDISNISFVSKLKNNWNDYVSKKFIDEPTNKINSIEFKNDLFNSIFIVKTIMLIIYEELKSYFQTSNPLFYLSKINEKNDISNVKEINNSNRDLINLIMFVRNKYLNILNSEIEIDIEEIETVNQALEFILDCKNFEQQSFWNPIPSYEIICNSDFPYVDEDDNFFLENNILKMFYLITMHPHLFGMEISNTNFSSIGEVKKLLFDIDLNDIEIKKYIDNESKLILCEKNYDYVTFINSSLAFLIIKNNNPIENITYDNYDDIELKENKIYFEDPNFQLVHKYFWAIIYCQSRVWKLIEFKKQVNREKNEKPWKLRNYIYQMNNLQIDSYDQFYGLPDIKKIIEKIDDQINLKVSINQFIEELHHDDKRYGKTKERDYLGIGVIGASIFGILDFFTCIFTIITVTTDILEESIKDYRNIIVISIGSILALILLIILIYVVITRIKHSWRFKKDSRSIT